MYPAAMGVQVGNVALTCKSNHHNPCYQLIPNIPQPGAGRPRLAGTCNCTFVEGYGSFAPFCTFLRRARRRRRGGDGYWLGGVTAWRASNASFLHQVQERTLFSPFCIVRASWCFSIIPSNSCPKSLVLVFACFCLFEALGLWN